MKFSGDMILRALQRPGLASLSVGSMMLLTVLGACSSAPPELQVRTVEQEVRMPPAIQVLPDPEPVRTLPVRWRVLTHETVPEGEFQVFAISAQDYENLSLNFADAIRWIREARGTLEIYRRALTNERR